MKTSKERRDVIDIKKFKMVLDKHGGLNAIRSRLSQDHKLQADLESAGLSPKIIENLLREPSMDSKGQIVELLVTDVYVLLTQIRYYRKRRIKWVEESFTRKLNLYRNGEDARMKESGITFAQIQDELWSHPDRYKEIDKLLKFLDD